jgi:predicted nucleic acid-binding protein
MNRSLSLQVPRIEIQFAFEELLIGATALHLGYEVATLNLRDFQRLANLLC